MATDPAPAAPHALAPLPIIDAHVVDVVNTILADGMLEAVIVYSATGPVVQLQWPLPLHADDPVPTG